MAKIYIELSKALILMSLSLSLMGAAGPSSITPSGHAQSRPKLHTLAEQGIEVVGARPPVQAEAVLWRHLLDFQQMALGYNLSFPGIAIKVVDEIRQKSDLAIDPSRFFILGLCDAETKTIYVNIKAYALFRPAQQMALIFHEAAHCMFDAPHTLEDTPNDLMYLKIIDRVAKEDMDEQQVRVLASDYLAWQMYSEKSLESDK